VARWLRCVRFGVEGPACAPWSAAQDRSASGRGLLHLRLRAGSEGHLFWRAKAGAGRVPVGAPRRRVVGSSALLGRTTLRRAAQRRLFRTVAAGAPRAPAGGGP